MPSPDSLIAEDPDSFAFFLLRNETLALCKVETELPYHKDRTAYLCSGRVSPKHNKIVFWADPVNMRRAFDLLVEQGHVKPDCQCIVDGTQTVRVQRKHISASRSQGDGVRNSQIKNLVNSGMKVLKGPSLEEPSSE